MRKQLFRPHKGSLDDSMRGCVEISDKAALLEIVKQDLSSYIHDLEISDETLEVKPYGFDVRTGWDTHIVTLKGYGVFGFTNCSLL